MACRILGGIEPSNAIKASVAAKVAAMAQKPHLAVIQVGAVEASSIYIARKQEACARVGIKSTLERMPENTTTQQLLKAIERLNLDKGVTGILVQLPLPKQIDEDCIINSIDPKKDVDGFHPLNAGGFYLGRGGYLRPATPSGVMKLLAHYGIDVEGKNAVVVGRSNIVGKPLTLMLLEKHATVTIVHSRSKGIEKITKKADIVAVAIGKPGFLKAGMVKKGAVIVDIGITRVEGKVHGDADFEGLKEVVSAITPVPGGIGPMTIACLLENVLAAHGLQNPDM
ncbi:bifunctional 5,10-methylenetetrahydrofolate dehydrogenase/5,10-methenyltetrahydrofolate cyclohydrolase [Candidatus Parvarchaeota archaeon]|nr:bifunctional 5,10-methylenetetrahydrofolate dehydrogenase/5,10-methenyltetrahydrofolate cyclohydrolase [Candidatus Parvarchaeota archaeon]